ncbi:short-chain dehydrogenase/reductase [Frankia sp. Ag45/Mut15]|uniref:Short-chain dehydrogenase/reductase n=1 Tax=Frankia umida TaxID=573489 RepID=A0ABT0JVF5_9ACTN|nr:short-chain dehydrogenase/reductase [Frankia umida]MCK9875519.1 short-chain dehydrogenase/reductase [Frankia umida]
MVYDVATKVVLITGAASGIGAALARRLHGRGARVALFDVDVPAGERLAADLGSSRALFLPVDVRDRAAIADAVATVMARFGQLDVVVANAGVGPPVATVRTTDPAEFDRVVAVNLTGTFNTVRATLEQVIARRGHVVVVSSVAAFTPGVGGAAYMMTKAAVEQLGRTLRAELAPHGATAGLACFGVVDTPLTRRTLDDDPLGRRLHQMLPRPMRSRLTAGQAADLLVDAITRRAPLSIAPARWRPYALLRGIANLVIDHRTAHDRRLHTLVHDIEQRARSSGDAC